ncbi:Hypothetical protein NTJ_12494 [Nesidiocoris tenuis]|uniref:Uncharacterized protein n=1 Tax=Nesidiocoris tenuis TaxID=355587 RepID=A0ABN7B7N8_9HEMI|nr:Hypothetical protein NTJ_12494 [Nesidiocoris tenuis]
MKRGGKLSATNVDILDSGKKSSQPSCTPLTRRELMEESNKTRVNTPRILWRPTSKLREILRTTTGSS